MLFCYIRSSLKGIVDSTVTVLLFQHGGDVASLELRSRHRCTKHQNPTHVKVVDVTRLRYHHPGATDPETPSGPQRPNFNGSSMVLSVVASTTFHRSAASIAAVPIGPIVVPDALISFPSSRCITHTGRINTVQRDRKRLRSLVRVNVARMRTPTRTSL
jgi:hypothetical protein